MEKASGSSEFARALSKGGFDFEQVARRQHEMFKKSRLKAIGNLAGGLIMLATTAQTIANRIGDEYFPAELAGDVTLAGFLLETSRRETKHTRLMLLEEQNTRVLVEMIKSVKQDSQRQNT